ncbi:MAG: hypothetical protein JST00_20695 [Deltaproteobacteria bacterium]|nr:hypothetical protein [Deltaproteobacteria bacterium]
MQREIGLRFQVRRPNGAVETMIVDADRALVGAAAHCEVRLGLGEGAPEHVTVIATPSGVQVAGCPGAPPPLLDGRPYVAGAWRPGSVLTIGHTQLLVDAVDLAAGKTTRSPLWALTPLPFLAAIAVFLATRSAPAGPPPIPAAPALLDAPVAECPAPASATLPGLAAERARVGFSKRERSPFSPSDGIEAVALLETASACYRAAGMPESERETQGAARALRAKLDEDYHVRRVRVEHAFKVGDAVAAKRELAVLLPMTAHRKGPYHEWLQSLDRYATAWLEAHSSRRL